MCQSVVLGAGEAVVNSLSLHRIYTLVVKAYICQTEDLISLGKDTGIWI